MNLLEIAKEMLGTKARGLTKSQVAIRALSTSDFPQLLENVMHKTLRRGYELQPKTFEPFVVRGTLADYRAAKRVSFGEVSSLAEVKEGGEYTYGSIGDGSESIQLAKYGKIIKITEETIVNDDLSAFTRLPQMMGSAASRLESNLVYNILLNNAAMADGTALFHADHGNLPSAAAINVNSYNAARKAMRIQKGIDNLDYLDLEPAFLVCGPDKELEAKQLLNSAIVPAQISNTNPFYSSAQAIVDPRISGNKWFLIASPSQIDTIELSYLEGMSGPELSQEKGFDGDYVKFKIKHVAGAKAIDHRGMVYNSGA
jgi:hypothetical protein